VSRLSAKEKQILFDGPPEALATCPDRRVRQFVEGEAGERLTEMQQGTNGNGNGGPPIEG
jgi:phospholipid/cholesterol/gamma-HCH transport system ATP-binding protein